MAKLYASCVHANFSLLFWNFRFENFLSVQVPIETLKKVSVLSDMNSEKSFYYSLIWKELSKNVSIA